MSDWHCTIPGKAQPQERVKGFRVGHSVRVYDPEKSRNYKAKVAEYARKYIGSHRERPLFPKGTALHVTLRVYITPPKSWSQKKKAQAYAGLILPSGRSTGDSDNYAKSILDGLTRSGVWYDDSQAVDIDVRKRYAEWPEVEIEVNAL